MAAAAGWALVSAGGWVCSNIATVGATAAGVTVAAPVVATAVAYKYGVTPALVVQGTSAAISTGVGAVTAGVVKGGVMTLKGLRYVVSLGTYEDDDDDD